MNRTATTSANKPQVETGMHGPVVVPVKGEVVVKSGYVPFVIWLRAKAVSGGALQNANIRVAAFSESSKGRPGYFPKVPPHDGRWQASNGAGMIPWKRPKPARTTTLCFVPTL